LGLSIFTKIPRCSGKAENEEYAEFDISVNTKKQNLNYAVYREEREIFFIFFIFCIFFVSMIYPEKCVLSDKKENLVLTFSNFEHLFLSTLKIR